MLPSSRRALVAGFVALFVLVFLALWLRSGMADFAVGYRAGERLMAGETLYQAADGHYQFKYLPASALIYLPFALLPSEPAEMAWYVISVLALVCVFAVVRSLVPLPHRRYLLVVSGIVLARYFLHELSLGQINILATLVMLFVTRALTENPETRHDAAAGVLAGIAAVIKPNALVFFPYLLVKRNWVAVASGLGTLAIALVIPAMFYGFDRNLQVLRDWYVSLSNTTPTLLTNDDNVSVIAFFTKWLGTSPPALAAAAVALGMLALLTLAVILRGGNKRDRSVLECALLMTLIPLVSPLGWDYTFIMSLLGVALLVNEFHTFPRAAQIVIALNFVVIALTVFDLMGRDAYTLWMQWSVTTINFVVVVVALAYLRFRGER